MPRVQNTWQRRRHHQWQFLSKTHNYKESPPFRVLCFFFVWRKRLYNYQFNEADSLHMMCLCTRKTRAYIALSSSLIYILLISFFADFGMYIVQWCRYGGKPICRSCLTLTEFLPSFIHSIHCIRTFHHMKIGFRCEIKKTASEKSIRKKIQVYWC